jgi:hypothetical protein
MHNSFTSETDATGGVLYGVAALCFMARPLRAVDSSHHVYLDLVTSNRSGSPLQLA